MDLSTMPLKSFFAAHALQGYRSGGYTIGSNRDAARRSGELAAAMLKARGEAAGKLSARDYFAVNSLIGFMAKMALRDNESLAQLAYRDADAMLTALDKEPAAI